MRKEWAVGLVVAMLLAAAAPAGVWESDNLLVNPAFDLGLNYWSESPSNGWGLSQSFGPNDTGAARRNVSSGTLSQDVGLISGERYRMGGYMKTGTAYQGRIDTPLGSTGWLKNGSTMTSYSWGPSVFSGGSASVALRYQLNSSGTGIPVFDSLWVIQVVYDPVLHVGSGNVTVNSDAPGGRSATVSLFLDSQIADDPTSWRVDWGDGISAMQPTLRANSAHVYTIGSGQSQSWTASLSGDNQAGSGLDSVNVTVLQRPLARLAVQGMAVSGGNIIEVNAGESVALSLLDSEGFIESKSFLIPGRLDQAGLEPLSSVIFAPDDIGQSFQLLSTVSNSGSGVNTDAVSVTFRVVPEPATMAVLALGGAAVMRKRRKWQSEMSPCEPKPKGEKACGRQR